MDAFEVHTHKLLLEWGARGGCRDEGIGCGVCVKGGGGRITSKIMPMGF